MIVVLATKHRLHTHVPLLRVRDLRLRTMAYEDAFRAAALPRATWVFTDCDRLGYWELELAARLHRTLADAGCRVLNDPARALGRIDLLQRLQRDGLNSFGAWRLADLPDDLPYPVFLRTNSAHRGILGDLLHDRAALDAQVALVLGQGVPTRELLVIEYRAEPVRDGLFHKRSMYRIGERMVPSLGVFESRWQAKYGELGVAGEALYEAEREALARGDDAPYLRDVFERAAIDYGRVDYALVRGRIEVYEINTNPQLPNSVSHPFDARRIAGTEARDALHAAFRALSADDRGMVRINELHLALQRRRDRFVFGARWIP